jgi:hypothetical protein
MTVTICGLRQPSSEVAKTSGSERAALASGSEMLTQTGELNNDTFTWAAGDCAGRSSILTPELAPGTAMSTMRKTG